ncbi:MAG: alpha/beta hydrolase [Porticoccaceae bacterium]
MNSRHLVDPELLPVLDMFPAVPLDKAALPEMREMMKAMIVPAAEGEAAVTVEEVWLPSHTGDHRIRALVYRPDQQSAAAPGLLEIHGGGYVVGLPEMSDAQNRHHCAALGCVVVAVDYRLAPETPHPGPVEDCYSALKWFHDNAAVLNVDSRRIAITGSSAGGGLAAALALLARDRGEVILAGQVLVMPMLDDRTVMRTERNPHPYAGEFIWTHANNRFGWTSLLGQEPGSEGVSPYASAARAEELAGLPATFISTGALDLFVEEDIEYARRLIAAGVSTELHLYAGGIHGFSMVAGSKVAVAHARDMENALRRMLGI